MPRVEHDVLEVARDAWQQDPAGTLWRELLGDVPEPVRLYIRKRFEREARTDFNQAWRIQWLTYNKCDEGYEILDNTPGY